MKKVLFEFIIGKHHLKIHVLKIHHSTNIKYSVHAELFVMQVELLDKCPVGWNSSINIF